MSYYTKITTAGLAAITAAMNNSSKVPITYMAFGDGNGYIPEPDENATSLVNEVYRVGVNKVEVHSKNPNWLVCEAIIPSAVGGFNIREVALYDSTGNTMLAIANYPPTYKPTVEEGAAKIQTIRIVIQVDNSGNFELIVDPDVVLATTQFVINHEKDADKIKFKSGRSLEDTKNEKINLLDFPANGIDGPLVDPTGVLDSTLGIRQAISRAKLENKELVGVGVFRITDKIVINCKFDGSNITFDVYDNPAIAVEISTGSSENPTDVLSLKDSGKIVLPDIVNKSKPVAGWDGQGIGVRYVNVQNTDIKERLVRDFAIGVQHTAYSQGCGYNTVIAGYLSNNKVNRQFIVGDLTGWTNRWDLYGGRYFHESYEGRTPVEGVIHFDVVPNATGFIINDINHWGGSLEGLTQQYHMRLGGAYINFWGIRLETPVSAGGIKVHLASAGIVGQGSSCGIFYGRGATASNGITEGRIELTADPLVNERLTLLSQQGTSYISVGGVVEIKKSTSSADDFIYCGVTPTFKYGENIYQNFSFGISSNSFRAKRKTDLFDRIKIDYLNGRIFYGGGQSEIVESLGFRSAGNIDINANFIPTGSKSLGSVTFTWAATYSAKYMFTATLGAFCGEGSPEGFVTASIGSTYQRTDGQAGTCFYVKETGTGNTGWIAK